MTIDEAYLFFKNIPSIHQKLQTLLDVGLGYIKLGQNAVTLSGGESTKNQAIKRIIQREAIETHFTS